MTLFQARSGSGSSSPAVARWFKRTLTRENVVDALKTLAWLAPLTLLIWIYAERQQTETVYDQSIPITIVSGDRNRFVKLEMKEKDANVIAELTGPHARLLDIRQRISPQSGGRLVEIAVPANLSPGAPHELDAAEALSKSPMFERSGVTVVSCKPATLVVYVDDYVEREAEVQRPHDVSNLEGTPVFSPAKVTVRGPAHKLPSGPLVVTADLQSTGLLDQPGKQNAQVAVSFDKLSIEGVTFRPAKVEASFEVRRSDVTYEIPSVSVHVQGPIEFLNRWKVQLRDNTPVIYRVSVVGPQDKIDALKSGEAVARAVLRVSSADIPTDGSWRSVTSLEFILPPGVSVAPDYVPKPIDVRVEKIADQ
jgi:hypothetical protein